MQKVSFFIVSNTKLIILMTLALLFPVYVFQAWAQPQDNEKKEESRNFLFNWKEDPERIKKHFQMSMSPADYRNALKKTGMMAAIKTPALLESRSAAQWTRVGPVGGFGDKLQWNGRVAGVRLVTTPATGGYYVYAGASGGGLWRMHSDNLFVWIPIASTLPNPAVRAFVIDPNNTDNIVVCTGDPWRYKGSGVYRTTDGGATWNDCSMDTDIPDTFNRVDFLLGSSSILVAASTRGIYRSTNGGDTWGRKWQTGDTSYEFGTTDLRIHPSDEDIMYAVDSGVGFIKSTDGGKNWNNYNNSNLPNASQWKRATMDICRDDPLTMVVMFGDNNNNLLGVWKTTNGGQNWNNITSNLSDIGQTQMFHAQAVGIKPDDPQHIYVGSAGMARTTNGGTSWYVDTFDYGHADITQLYFGQNSDNAMWICNDGGIYYYPTGLTTSVGMNGNSQTGLIISQIDNVESDRDFSVISMIDNGVISSTDDGLTWSIIASPADGGGLAITDAEARNFWYCTGIDPVIGWRLHRALGNAWDKSMAPPPDGAPATLFYDPFGDLIYITDGPNIYHMPSGGEPGTWQNESGLGPFTFTIRLIWGSKADGKTLFFQTRNAGRDLPIARWTGSGWNVTVTPDLAPAGGKVEVVAPSSEWPGECWVGFKSPVGTAKVAHTTDFGATWDDVSGDLTNVGVVYGLAPTPFDPQTVYAATEIGVFRTLDAGQNWTPFQDGMPIVQCKDIMFVADDTTAGMHKLVVATYGLGLWTRDVPSAPIIYVDKTHTGTEDGSLERPYKTIAAAISAAPAGVSAIIAIRSNTYSAPQTINKNLKLVTYAGTTTLQ